MKMKISKYLKTLRLEQNLSQKEVARAIGVTISAYSNYEQGIREPSYDVLKNICRCYDVYADYLLGLKDFD